MSSKKLVTQTVLVFLVSVLVLTSCAVPITPAPGPSPTEDKGVPSAALARDAALAHLGQISGDKAPPEDLTWSEKRTTPQGLVGASTLEYTAGEWIIRVSFPIVAPQATIYTVQVSNAATGFRWEGRIDAGGQIMEPTSSDKERVTSLTVSEAALATVIEGSSAFAFDLYQLLAETGDNLFYSPYSISLALAMTYAGARGETEQQMAEALHFGLLQGDLHPAFNGLDLELASRGEGARGKDGEGFRLHIVNALWGQEGYTFLTSFLDLLAENYGAGMHRLGFSRDPEEARATINRWVSEQTEDRIEKLIPQGLIDHLTTLVLTNAVYFNAAWANPFKAEATEDGPFYRLDGSEVTVPMMRQAESFRYVTGEGYQAVELPYDGHELSMVILLPTRGAFEDFEQGLDAERVAGILEGMESARVALTMPRYEFDSAFQLKEALAALGMPIAFGGQADFSGMTGSRDLFISEVVHQGYVAVDEAGTEAAAATAVVMLRGAMPSKPVEMTLDHPFIFFIRDVQTGSILFVGRVLDPSA